MKKEVKMTAFEKNVIGGMTVVTVLGFIGVIVLFVIGYRYVG